MNDLYATAGQRARTLELEIPRQVVSRTGCSRAATPV